MGIFDRGRSNDELLVVTELARNAKGRSVSNKNLTERKIANKPAFSYLMDGEQPHYILHNRTKGLSYNESGRKDTIQPSDSSWALGIFTDRRILFVTGLDNGVDQRDIEYDDVESVEAATGFLKNRLSLRTLYSNYEFYVSNSIDADEFEECVRFIRRKSDLEKGNVADPTDRSTPQTATDPDPIDTSDEKKVLRQLREMDPYEFEYFVADLWDAQGWETSVSQASVDQGVDVIATKKNPFAQKQVIQAKRYAENNTIGSPKIQQYASLRQQEEGADVSVVVTTSGFSSQAKELARKLNVKLIDAEGIYRLLSETERFDLISSYAPATIESSNEPTESREQWTDEMEVDAVGSVTDSDTSPVSESVSKDDSFLKKFKECPNCGEFVGMKRTWGKDLIFPKLRCAQCETRFRKDGDRLQSVAEYRTRTGSGTSDYSYYGVLSGIVLSLFGIVVPALMLLAWILLVVSVSRDTRYIRANSERNPSAGYWVWGIGLFPIIGIVTLGSIGGGLSLLVVGGAYLIQRYRNDTTSSGLYQKRLRKFVAEKRS